MIFKKSSSARAPQRKSPSHSLISHQKRSQQKVLKNRKNEESRDYMKHRSSYLIWVALSGIFLTAVIVGFFLIRPKLFTSLDLNDSYTVAVIQQFDENKSVHIVSFRGTEQSIQVMTLPLTYVENEDKQLAQHMSLLFSSIQHNDPESNILAILNGYLGIPVDTIVRLKSDDETIGKSMLLNIFQPINNKAITSPFSYLQRLQLWKYVLLTDSSHIETQQLLQQTVGHEPEMLLSKTELINIVQKYYSDTALRKSSPTIAVVNNTTQNGLAKRLGDVFNSWGFSVIQLGSEHGNYKKNSEVVIHDDLLSTSAFSRLQLLFPEGLSYKSDQIILQKYRSQIVLFVGEDFLSLQPSDFTTQSSNN